MSDDASERLKQLRSRFGITQEWLASTSGLARSTIARLESPKHKITRSACAALARAFGVSIDDMWGYLFGTIELEDIAAKAKPLSEPVARERNVWDLPEGHGDVASLLTVMGIDSNEAMAIAIIFAAPYVSSSKLNAEMANQQLLLTARAMRALYMSGRLNPSSAADILFEALREKIEEIDGIRRCLEVGDVNQALKICEKSVPRYLWKELADIAKEEPA